MDTLKTMVGVIPNTHTQYLLACLYNMYFTCQQTLFFYYFCNFFGCVAHVHISPFFTTACGTNSTNQSLIFLLNKIKNLSEK